MSDQAALFPPDQTRSFFDALARHEKRYGFTDAMRRKLEAAAWQRQLRKERRDALCQGFFEAMLRPPQRDAT